MNNDKYNQDLKKLEGRNARKNLLIATLAVSLVLAMCIILQTIGSTRTVVVPPTVEKSFWVTHNRASSEYLEQMAGFSAWLILDVTPASIGWKTNTLLEYVTPDSAGEMKQRMELEADRLRKLNAATYFTLRELAPNEDAQSVLVIGQLRTQINAEETSAVEKQYLAKFEFKGGRMHLKDFKEVVNETKQ